jgi:hypothetical protein
MFVNLTPHSVRIVTDPDTDHAIVVPPSGTVARAGTASREIATFDGVPCHTVVFFNHDFLPPAKPGVRYIASALVAQRAWKHGRHDVASPGDLIRDADGNVTGCRGLVVSAQFQGNTDHV